MQTRFECPVEGCGKHFVLDMPETTIHLRCGCGKETLVLALGLGGEVKAQVFRKEDEQAPFQPRTRR